MCVYLYMYTITYTVPILAQGPYSRSYVNACSAVVGEDTGEASATAMLPHDKVLELCRPSTCWDHTDLRHGAKLTLMSHTFLRLRWERWVHGHRQSPVAFAWEEVASQLSVAIQSACGMRIFGSRLGVVSCIAMSKKIDDEVNRFSQGDMTEATVKQAMATMKEACEDLGKDWTAPRASDGKIMYKYRGVDCLTKVTSHQQEALLKLIAEVRTRAINCKLLDPIWCECQLVDVNAAEKKTVAPSLLTDAKLVRKAAAELISGGSGAERRS